MCAARHRRRTCFGHCGHPVPERSQHRLPFRDGRDAIRKAGAELRFLPPYSPDFNPIEMAFSKLKAYLKRRAARSVNELWETIGEATDTLTPDECQNYFAAAGYGRV